MDLADSETHQNDAIPDYCLFASRDELHDNPFPAVTEFWGISSFNAKGVRHYGIMIDAGGGLYWLAYSLIDAD